jgi:hypothetical protein
VACLTLQYSLAWLDSVRVTSLCFSVVKGGRTASLLCETLDLPPLACLPSLPSSFPPSSTNPTHRIHHSTNTHTSNRSNPSSLPPSSRRATAQARSSSGDRPLAGTLRVPPSSHAPASPLILHNTAQGKAELVTLTSLSLACDCCCGIN